jgi:hypothetical protein
LEAWLVTQQDQEQREVHDIEVERYGMRLRGTYTVDHNIVTVRSELGIKAMLLGGDGDPDVFARRLLMELLDEPKAGF